MKGTFFQKPLEYKIEIPGESWNQGDTLKGNLIVNNHGNASIDLSNAGCHLCLVNYKKLKAKDEKAFTLIKSISIGDIELSGKSEHALPIEFKLNDDCSISDTTNSLYILCGKSDRFLDCGMLELKIVPVKIILEFINIFESFFRFKFKALKNKKDYIEAKISPPDAREWHSIQTMTLQIKIKDSELHLNFAFKLKKMAYDASAMSTMDQNLDISKILSKKEYSSFGDSPNQAAIQKVIQEVLDQVKIKPII